MVELRRTSAFAKWLDGLTDALAFAHVVRRINRLAEGNAGDMKSVGGGVSEMRIDHGPGYRVYFTRRGATVAVLLCGGDKSTQRADIEKAQRLAKEWADGT